MSFHRTAAGRVGGRVSGAGEGGGQRLVAHIMTSTGFTISSFCCKMLPSLPGWAHLFQVKLQELKVHKITPYLQSLCCRQIKATLTLFLHPPHGLLNLSQVFKVRMENKSGVLRGRSQHLSVSHVVPNCFVPFLLLFLSFSSNQRGHLSSKLDAGALSPHFLPLPFLFLPSFHSSPSPADLPLVFHCHWGRQVNLFHTCSLASTLSYFLR